MYVRMPGQASLGVCVCMRLGALAHPGLPDVTSAPEVTRLTSCEGSGAFTEGNAKELKGSTPLAD